MLFAKPRVKSDAYEFGVPPSPWHHIDPGNADVAYQYPADRSTISVNSVCDQYQDQSLDELTKSDGLGIADGHTDTRRQLDVSGFPALQTQVSGTLKAVPVTVRLTVVRTTHCVYDFMLVARSAAFAGHSAIYEHLVQAFHERQDQ